MRRTDPADRIVQVAPLICIEVLSPLDTMSSMQKRIDDYTRMGVEHIWLVDPVTRHAYVAIGGPAGACEQGVYRAGHAHPRLPYEVFAELDDMLTQG